MRFPPPSLRDLWVLFPLLHQWLYSSFCSWLEYLKYCLNINGETKDSASYSCKSTGEQKHRSVKRSDSTCLSAGFSTAAQSTRVPIPGSHKEERNDQRSQVIKAFHWIQRMQEEAAWPWAKLARQRTPRWIVSLLREREKKLFASRTQSRLRCPLWHSRQELLGYFVWPKQQRKEEMLIVWGSGEGTAQVSSLVLKWRHLQSEMC